MVLFKIDAEKGDGPGLVERYSVAGLPTFVLTNTDAVVIDRWRGYMTAADFIQRLDAALGDPTTIEQKQARYESSPSVSDAEKLSRYHRTRDEHALALRYLREAQRLNEDPNVDYRYAIFDCTAEGAFSEQFTLAEVKQAADAALEAGLDTSEVVDVGVSMVILSRRFGDHEVMVPYLDAAVKASEGTQDEGLMAMRRSLLIDHALFVEKNPTHAFALKKASLRDGWTEDSQQLNAFAWWCFENNVNLEEADALARKGVELAESPKDKAMILDTVAEICNARGSCKDAVYFIELALEHDPENEHYQKQLQRFRKLLAEQG